MMPGDYIVETRSGTGPAHEAVVVSSVQDAVVAIVQFKLKGWPRVLVFGPGQGEGGLHRKLYDDGCTYAVRNGAVWEDRYIEPMNLLEGLDDQVPD